MADISFNIAGKDLKIAQIAHLNQPFQLLHLVHIYGHSFYELSGMLMRKNVNNDVSKDWPMQTPVIRTAAKFQAKIDRRLTEMNSRYYGLLLMRTLTRGPTVSAKIE